MRGTDHPSIVKLFAFSESAEYYYLVLERQYPLFPVLTSFSEFVEIQ
jgi:hypothetical protein